MRTTNAAAADAAGGGMFQRLDNRSTPCSLGLLRVKERLAGMPLGATLEVVTRDKFAPYEVPVWVEREGLELTSIRHSGFWLFGSTIFRIRKTVAVRAPRRKIA